MSPPHTRRETEKDPSVAPTTGYTPAQHPPARIHPQVPPPDTHRPVSMLESDSWAHHIPLSAHVQFFKDTNWAASRLGPLHTWCKSLRLQTFTLFADTRAAVVYWGTERCAVYNEAFIPLAGKTHPKLMGQPFYEGFPEIWDTFKGVFDHAAKTGITVDVNEQEMTVERGGFTEETYFTGNFIPVRGDTGAVEGFYNAVHEVSRPIVNGRRRTMLNRMQIHTGLHTPKLADQVLPALETNPRDIPMALIYGLDEDSQPGSEFLISRGSIGVPDGHPLAIDRADLNSNEGLMPLFRQARSKPITVPVDERFNGIQWRGFAEPSSHISIMPITDARRVYGFVLVGANPRRAIDEDHHQFMRDLSSQVCAIASAIVSAHETRTHAERLEKALEASQKQRQYMAENASFGMAAFSPEGRTNWANDQYYVITGQTRGENDTGKPDFMEAILEEDQQGIIDMWLGLLDASTPHAEVELRLKRLYNPPLGPPEPARIQAKSNSVIEDGRVTYVMSSVTDVSAFRWAEASEARKAKEASEAKRQQEEFIDFISHELRNPLSGIFGLTEAIMNSDALLENPEAGGTREELAEIVRKNIEDASTILICANHQKRIVDDVLTLSKLEYSMISITPRPTQIPLIINRTMKMFEAETRSHEIEIKINRDPNQGGWVLCDESRLQQILINLLTNAIKFTKSERRKEIIVTYGSTTTNPRANFPEGIHWAQNSSNSNDLTLNTEWGTGQILFLTFAVTDTGVGMTTDEIMKLFNRFEQASVKTSIKYGGTGLGLYLSQRLAEVQSGEIGVISTPSEGSTFAFYIKCRLSNLPDPSPPMPATRPSTPQPVSSALSAIQFPIRSASDSQPPKMHVLLVEDNLINQRIVQRQLKGENCVVHLANHGLEALQLIQKSELWVDDNISISPLLYPSTEIQTTGMKIEEKIRIDIILMDWQMPVMDGLECSKRIRDWERRGLIKNCINERRIQIIATTANARGEQKACAIEAGIDEVFTKPFQPRDLVDFMRGRLFGGDIGSLGVLPVVVGEARGSDIEGWGSGGGVMVNGNLGTF